jgi:hypothetical protein
VGYCTRNSEIIKPEISIVVIHYVAIFLCKKAANPAISAYFMQVLPLIAQRYVVII